MSHIELIFGPMFSGKTSELLRRVQRHIIAKRKCLLIKYAMDQRYSVDKISTHDHVMCSAISCHTLAELGDQYLDYDVVGIDEGQFYDDIVEFAEKAANDGKIVIVSALDGTFQRKPFKNILNLIPLAENVVKLTSVCMLCHKEASFSKRIVAGDSVELIGGAESYVPVCRKCFFASESTAKKEEPVKEAAQTPLQLKVAKVNSTSPVSVEDPLVTFN